MVSTVVMLPAFINKDASNLLKMSASDADVLMVAISLKPAPDLSFFTPTHHHLVSL